MQFPISFDSQRKNCYLRLQRVHHPFVAIIQINLIVEVCLLGYFFNQIDTETLKLVFRYNPIW